MFKTLYTTLANRDRQEYQYTSDKPSLTIQEPSESCDINNIVDLYCRSGRAIDLLTIQPWTGEDVSVVPNDYLECLEYIETVKQDFDNLPSKIRQEVGGTPLSMLQWITNPANKERGVELGLFAKPVQDVVLDSPVLDSPVELPNTVVQVEE